MSPALRREAAATFGLVLLGTGACVARGMGAPLGDWGIGLAWGLAVYAMARAFSAQMNPAASLAIFLRGEQSAGAAAAYAAAQTAGALAASLALKLSLGARAGLLGATLPSAGLAPAFAAELMMTSLLLGVVLRAAPARAPLLAGLIVGLEAALGGPISGASMNPARSLAPALVSGATGGLWIYLTAPFLGAALAAAYLRGRPLTEARA